MSDNQDWFLDMSRRKETSKGTSNETSKEMSDDDQLSVNQVVGDNGQAIAVVDSKAEKPPRRAGIPTTLR